MKRTLFVLCVCIAGLSLLAQQVAEKSVVINVEVPVRVFLKGSFVDNLTIDDFEVFEDGVPQKIEAVYFVKKRSIERSEEKRRFAPVTKRHFFLLFELTEYNPRLERAVSYFVRNVLYPGDDLTIATPMKTYKLRGKALEVKSDEEIIEQLKGLVRRDTLLGNSEYNSLITRLEEMARSLMDAIMNELQKSTGDKASIESLIETEEINLVQSLDDSQPLKEKITDEQLEMYFNLLMRLESIRHVDEEKMYSFAEYLKDKEGQKYVFMFYQKEYIPQLDPNILVEYLSLFQDRPNFMQTMTSLFEMFKRDIDFNVEKVKQAFADSSVSIHFLYITKPAPLQYGVYMKEQSEDIFGPFQEMAHATGGYAESSANADYLFQQAVAASDNYYLLYYSPLLYTSDGKFRNIKVSIKNKNYRITHRLGYFAN
jgi:VWFA-related protein